MTAPTVAVVILNHNGRQHLAGCLPAVLALSGLKGPEAVVVADNGSTDGSAEWLAASHPAIRLIRFDTNLGFAAGNNRAAEAVDADHVLFLNNDTIIDPAALGYLASAVEQGATGAGARLVSWDGRHLDFDGGGASFTGHGHALGIGEAVDDSPRPRELSLAAAGQDAAGRPRPSVGGSRTEDDHHVDGAYRTLFTSGAAMLIHRRTFLDLGGFDPGYFAYYEDVDLGWRLNLAGHRVVHVPDAVVRHRHGGTAGAVSGERALLYERNALMTVAKNYADGNLERVLPAALSLAAVRAGADPSVIPAARFVESREGLPLPSVAWPGWSALAPLNLDWSPIGESRAAVQSRRKLEDGDVLPLLLRPYAPVPPDRRGWQALAKAVEVFELERILGPWRPSLFTRLRYGF